MLRRRSLKSKSDLKCRKSTSSSHGVLLEHLDPVLAQRDAHIAACEAYTRAQGRPSVDMSLFPPTPESSPRRQRSERSSGCHDGPGISEDDGQELARRQSVRFVGPCSMPARARRGWDASSSHDSKDVGSVRTEEGVNNTSLKDHTVDDTNASVHVPSPPRRAPPPVPLPKIATGYLTALEAQDEYYTPEDDIASAPSSYRRLHRSKSMLTGHQGFRRSQDSSVSFLNRKSPPLPSDSRRLFHSEPGENKVSHDAPMLKAPKSMSFLGRRSSQSRASTSRDTRIGDGRRSDLPNLREDEFTKSKQNTPQVKYKTSTIFNPRSRRTGSRLRASVRSSSPAEGMGPSSPDPGTHPDASGTLRSKARKASRTLKVKLKNLFTHAKPEGEMEMPCQHIDSQRSHAANGFGLFQESNTNHEVPADDGQERIHNVPAKIPSFQVVPPELRSTKASLESLRSEAERKVSDSSSLTSWVHSGPSTLTSQQQQQWREWEKQRLSVIRETGTHAPSPSMWRQPLGTGLFQGPENTSREPVVQRPPLDSQRVYSALMKRMQAMRPADGEPPASRLSPSTPAAELGRPTDGTPDTIKRVISERKYGTPSDGLVTPTRPSKRGSVSRGQLSRTVSGSTDSETQFKEGLRFSRDNSGVFTRSQDAASLRSDSSHAFRTASPYRRALRKSMQEEQNAWSQQSSSAEQDSGTGTQVHHSHKADPLPETDSDSAKDLDLDYTESIYSTDDGERMPAADDTPTAYRPVKTGTGNHERLSTASSIDWEMWLSANVGKYDPSSPSSPSKHSELEFALPTMPRSFPSGHFPAKGGHVREPAQIYGGDDDDVFEPRTRLPTLPTTPVATLTPTPLRTVEHNAVQQTSPLREVKRITTTKPIVSGSEVSLSWLTGNGKGLLVENENPAECGGSSSPSDVLLPPPIPPRSKLRPSPLRVSRSRYDESILSSPGLTEAVRRQFGPVFGSGDGGRAFV